MKMKKKMEMTLEIPQIRRARQASHKAKQSLNTQVWNIPQATI